MSNPPFEYRVGVLGAPNSMEGKFNVPVVWNDDSIGRLKALGFNTVQINVAWGSRPGDEPLNLEDVVELSSELQAQYPQPVPLRCDPSRRAERRRMLWDRIELCKRARLRMIFHYGAPYNAHARYGDGPPNCISNEREVERMRFCLMCSLGSSSVWMTFLCTRTTRTRGCAASSGHVHDAWACHCMNG